MTYPEKNWKDALKKPEEVEEIEKISGLAGKDVAAIEDTIKEKLREKQVNDVNKKIASTKELALRAVKKEAMLERLLKNEQKLQEKEKIKDLLALKAKEEKKKDCLDKALKEREELNKKNRFNQIAELEINRIKNEAKKDVQAERQNLLKKLQDIKKKSQRKQRMIMQQIDKIRSTIAKNLIDANKKGNMEICLENAKDQEKTNQYCDKNFVDDFSQNTACKEIDNHCPLCCDNEFGNMFLNLREECYKKCDHLINKELGGDWIWTGSFLPK